MNTFFMLCLTGILLNSLGISLNIFTLNIAGSIILAIGMIKLALEGSMFKKGRLFSILAVPFTIAGYVLFAMQPADSADTIRFTGILCLGINVFFHIYFTYYFTESLIDYSKSENKLACTKSFRSTWTLCGIVTFLYFMLCTSVSVSDTVNIIARIILLIALLYYCFTIYGCQKILFKNFLKK